MGLRIQQILEMREKSTCRSLNLRTVHEGGHLFRRFFRGFVREELVHQLKGRKDLDTVLLVQIPPDRDPASRASSNDDGSPRLPDVL